MPNPTLTARRRAKGLTQSGLAELVCDFVEQKTGRRPSTDGQAIGRYECGKITWPNAATRRALRHILGAATDDDLGLRPTRPKRRPSPPHAQTPPESEESPVHRREFLTSAAAVGVEAVMFRPTGRSLPAAQLRPRLARAQALYRQADYAILRREMPDLLDLAIGLGDQGILSQVYCLATELELKGNDDAMAYFTASEARKAAQASGDVVCEAEAAWMTCVMLRHAGKPEAAFDVIQAAAGKLEKTGLKSDLALSTYGHMMVTTAYTAAMAGDVQSARSFYTEGLSVATKFDHEHPHGMWVFGPKQAKLYGISVANNLGDTGAALKAAASLNPGSLPTPERQERYWYDLTKTHLAAEQPERARDALREVLKVAPQAGARPRVRKLAEAAGVNVRTLNRR